MWHDPLVGKLFSQLQEQLRYLRPPNSLSNSVYAIFSNEMKRKFPFLKLFEGKHEEKSTNNKSKILILKRAKRFQAKRGHMTRGVVSEGGWGPNFLDFFP